MAPGVPFAVMAGVQLLSVAAALGLAAAACFPRLRRRTTPLFVLGALLLALADSLTATRYGHPTSTWIAVARIAGLLLMAAALASGVLKPPGGPIAVRSAATAGTGAVGAAAVIVPLGTTIEAATATAIAAAIAAVASLSTRRHDRVGATLLGVAFLSLSVAGALSEAAATSRAAALAVLAARGIATLLFFADLARLARSSVLAKVVTAMLAGVLVMALGAVTVGSVVAGVVGRQQADQARQLAISQTSELDQVVESAGSFALVVAACGSNISQCERALQVFGALPGSFAATVNQRGRVNQLDTGAGQLSTSSTLQLAGQPIVRAVLRGETVTSRGASTLAVLNGQLTAIGVAPIAGDNAAPNARPVRAAIYGGRITNGYAAEQKATTTYDVTVIVGGAVAASNLPPREADVIAAEARRAGVTSGALSEQRTLVRRAQGANPTAAFASITARDGTPLGVLAVSQPARIALAAERRAFVRLFVTALGVMILVSVLALLLGRRIVEPVRRLTVVASRVRRGDLTATAGAAGSDEVGALSRAFDAMTASVSQLTGDLRAAAAQEATLRARLETVLASMADGLVATDADRRVTSINPAAAELAGHDMEEAIGLPLVEVLDIRALDGESRVDITGDRVQADGLLVRPGRAAVPVQIAVAPLAGDEESAGVVVVVRDQSRERDLERMKTEFLSNVSHELRTPLTPIRGYAEILRRRPDLPRQQTVGYVDTILDSTARMSRVVDLLVDVAAIEAGRVQADVLPLSVDRYVTERLDAARVRCPERADDLKRRVARGLPKVLIDPRWLGKALDELVDNAVKHTPPGTPITLFAETGSRGRVRLGVRDTGPGIDPEALPSLFTDFVQADGSATRQVGGLGLGLAFVRRVAETLGLELAVASQPGRGAEFTLEVPAESPRSQARARGAGGAMPSSRTPSGRTRRPGAARKRAGAVGL